MFLDNILPVEPSIESIIVGSFLAVGSLIIYIKPVRNKSRIIQRMFLSFDRPEDRPNTLLWLSTQITVGYLVLIPSIIYFFKFGYSDLILIPILVNGIGDGLAEPVGVRFGKHHYETKAMFTDKTYVRTLEGSACVLITGFIVVAMHFDYFTTIQFVLAMLIVPIVMTLTEAYSPHTWDTPFLMFTGYMSLLLIMQI